MSQRRLPCTPALRGSLYVAGSRRTASSRMARDGKAMNRPASRWGGPAASRGATLLELVITLAIVGLLVTIAQFTWQMHSMRIRRSDATNGLLMLAAAQEAFYLEAGRYASSVRDPPPVGLGMGG